MQHNQIRLYPFDAEENDAEELQLNERIRVSCRSVTCRAIQLDAGRRDVSLADHLTRRKCCLSLLLVPSGPSFLTGNLFEDGRTDGASSTSRTNGIAILCTCATS